MNNAIPLLTALVVAPLIGAVACFAVKNRIRKYVAFGAALVTLALGLVVFFLAGAQQLAGDLVWIDCCLSILMKTVRWRRMDIPSV